MEGERASGPPKPAYLSTTASTLKNDPLYKEAIMPEPGREARPIAKEVVVYPGFYSLDQVARQIHKSVTSTDNGYSRRVPESATYYYVASMAYARLLKVLDMSGRPISHEENTFMKMMYAGSYQVPAILGYFFDSIGNTKLNRDMMPASTMCVITSMPALRLTENRTFERLNGPS